MYDLYIRIDENGNTINHPYFTENLIDCGIDPTTDPSYAPFKRVTQEESGIVVNLLQMPVVSYGKVDNIYTDIWSVIDLTGDELTAKKAEISQQVTDGIADRIDTANILLEKATLDSDKQNLQNYLVTIKAFTVTDYNVPTISWPVMPKLTQNPTQ
jgi:hypothetical protein